MANLVRKSMRLFGLPYQFTDAVDPRLDEISTSVGNKFLRNMILEGPVITFIPGVPDYLPADTTTDKKVTTTAALLENASDGFGSLKSSIDSSSTDDFRLYDFKRDYTRYMQYVNILCRAGATFLELDAQLDGTSLQSYDWRNYRWDADSYSSIAGRLEKSAMKKVKNLITGQSANFENSTTTQNASKELNKTNPEIRFKNGDVTEIKQKINDIDKQIDKLITKLETKNKKVTGKAKNSGAKQIKKLTEQKQKLLKAIPGVTKDTKINDTIKAANEKWMKNYIDSMKAGGFLYDTTVEQEDTEEDASLEDLLQNYNYVQFYVDPSSGVDESWGNATSESSLKSMMEGSSGIMKDIAFMANSGGIPADQMQAFAGEIGENINAGLQAVIGGNSLGSALTRLINLGNETLKGNNFIMPDIYQSSDYSKQYSITIHLKTPYGTKLGYYLNVFVPLMHILALGLPRQATANSYGSPFLVKAYIEGCLTCNMGIITSISISRVEDSWSIDGLASEIDVTLGLVDLYSDMSMSPQSDPILFVNNSSLIEFLATNCGLSLIVPNIGRKADMWMNAITESFKDIKRNFGAAFIERIDESITKTFTGLTF